MKGMAFLLPFLTGAAEVASAITTVAPHFFGGGYAPAGTAATGDYTFGSVPAAGGMYDDPYASVGVGGYVPAQTAAMDIQSGSQLALPGQQRLPKTFLTWVKRVLVLYGPQMAQAVVNELAQRRQRGQNIEDAIEQMSARLPKLKTTRVTTGRRRRMNPTNVRALRRAVRRVRGFKRITRKVRGLGIGVRRPMYPSHHRRRRRGDLWDVEEFADERDEAADLLDGGEGEEIFLDY